MLKKNLPIYIFILLLLAGVVFLSPYIMSSIEADINSLNGKELITNGTFDNQQFNHDYWSRISTANTKTGTKDNNLEINCGKDEKDYVELSQKISVIQGKFYRLSAYIGTDLSSSKVKASVGFKEMGPASAPLISENIVFNVSQIHFEKFLEAKRSITNPYFYLRCEGPGSITVQSLSVIELDQLPQGTTANPFASKSPSPTPTASSSPIPLQTPSMAPIISASASVLPKTPEKKADQITVDPGWNIVGFLKNITSDNFIKSDITTYQMLGGKWFKYNSKNSKPLNKNGAVYLFNSKSNPQSIEIVESQGETEGNAGAGWNLLYNSSDSSIDGGATFSFISKAGDISDLSLSSLFENKKASTEAFVLKQTEKGVGMSKIDLTKQTIPPQSAFWFYIFDI